MRLRTAPASACRAYRTRFEQQLRPHPAVGASPDHACCGGGLPPWDALLPGAVIAASAGVAAWRGGGLRIRNAPRAIALADGPSEASSMLETAVGRGRP